MTTTNLFTGTVIAKEQECSFINCVDNFTDMHVYRAKLWTNRSGSLVSICETADCTECGDYIVSDVTDVPKSAILDRLRQCRFNYLDRMQRVVVNDALNLTRNHEVDFALTIWKFSREHPEASIDEIFGQAIHRVLGNNYIP